VTGPASDAAVPGGIETIDAVVVGANLCGLVTAYLLDRLGFRVALLERGARVGGANASFTTPDGSTFDLGMHVLDDMRSEVTTRLFRRVIDGRVQRVLLRRGVVLRGRLVPYNAAPADLPDELRRLLPGDEIVDDLGDEPPTRERLRRYYGAYADFVFDEVLPSYRCEWRHKQLGVDESRLMTNIYPWFFPRAARRPAGGGESRTFHDRLRGGEPQYVLYPKEGGFAGFAQAFLTSLGPGVEVLTGRGDLRFEVEPTTHFVRWIEVGDRKLTSRHVFWCAGWPWLCELLGLEVQNLATDRMLLGSFRFDTPAVSDFNEILVADPSFHIDRVSFPGRFAGTDAPLLQVEFAFPAADERIPLESATWRETWLADLWRLGLVGAAHRVESFEFRCFRMHYNSFGAEGQPRREPDSGQIHPRSNVRPVAPTQQNRNLNGSVPLYLEYVARVLREHP
jgi:hypothetical protein